MRATITISVSEKEAAVIRDRARGWTSVSRYLRDLARRDANRLVVNPLPRNANDMRPQVPRSHRCLAHQNLCGGPPVSVTLTDAVIEEWL